MRVLLVPILLLAAGCVTSSGPAVDGDPPVSGASNILPWTLVECQYIVGWSEADAAIIQQNLPEGFTVRAGPPLGLPLPAAGPTARAIIGTEAFDCASGTGLNGTVEPMTYASIWIPVTPPEAYVVEGIEEVYYKIHVLVPDAPRRETMVALGLSVGDGAIAWDSTTAPTPDGIAAAMTIDGAGDFRFELLQPQTVSAQEGREFMELTPAGEGGVDGFAVWRSTFEWVGDTYTNGRGFIDWPEGHWVTEAIGSARAPATFHAGVWSFNGTVALPAR